ncbi:hypothetical protein BDN72DRAFT_905221 [Pluteus cervinus]|uniref:Uncharacterized protein n=1 Tax=Pluteus cervinus TaxID=181527 RepID=A0ACD3A3C1_9AGAR|nr:hypothetical protein BDN72DRAFT_905221 [Pluteus cervinus]
MAAVDPTPQGTTAAIDPVPQGVVPYRLSKEQTEWLRKECAPGYIAMINSLNGEGARGLVGVFGKKGEYVDQEVIPPFVEKFYPTVPPKNLGAVKKAVKSSLNNFANYRLRKQGLLIPPPRSQPSTQSPPPPPPPSTPTLTTSSTLASLAGGKPRLVTAMQVFTKDRQAECLVRFRDYRTAHNNPHTTQNLPIWSIVTKDFWLSLTQEEQADYQDRATEINALFADLPPRAEIFKNQAELPQAVLTQFDKIHGFNWGQYGDGGMFIIGAYRTEDGDLQVYNVSASSAPDGCPFVAPPEAYAALRTPFVEYMERMFPASSAASIDEPSASSAPSTGNTMPDSTKNATNDDSSSIPVDEDFEDLDNNEDYRGFKRLRRRSMTVESEDDIDMGSPSSRLTSPSSSSLPDLVSPTTTPTSSRTPSRSSSHTTSRLPSPAAPVVSPVQIQHDEPTKEPSPPPAASVVSPAQIQHDEPAEDPSPCTTVKKTYSRRGRKPTRQVAAAAPSALEGDSTPTPAHSRGRQSAKRVSISTVPAAPVAEELVERRSKR